MWKAGGDVPSVAGVNRKGVLGSVDLDAPAVELDLVEPALTAREVATEDGCCGD